MHSRCNLRCDYCYVYEMGDDTWRSRPRVMERATIDAVAFRVAEHAAAHGVTEVEIVLHGGEALLAGAERIIYAVTSIRAKMGNSKCVKFITQTNGLLLDEEFLELFESLDVQVALSMDGGQEMHDRHRRNRTGGGSYAAVAAAAERLAGHPRLFSGLLGVIDLRNDPVRAYEELLRFSPPSVDFLLPHGNWSAPPPGRQASDATSPYGDWLVSLFDRWYQATPKETSVRLFEEIMSLVLGGSSRTEGIGLSPVSVVVVETDGDILQSDLLTTAYPTAGATGLSVLTDPFDAALRGPHSATRQGGTLVLSEECQSCPIVRVCGGGLYAHRYRAGTGFDNPSVYCPDLYRLINHIAGRLAADLNVINRPRTCR
jgi:uncharacterized protein